MAEGGFFRCKQGFTVVQNAIVKDKTVSLGAKGLYLLIQSYITMPDQKWRKKDFEGLCVEGRRKFENAWNELKENGYIKQHRRISGKTQYVEYELLDEPVMGPYTYYYNAKGEVTGTDQGMFDNREETESLSEGDDIQDIVDKEEDTQYLGEAHFGSLVNGSHLNGAHQKGSRVEGALVKGGHLSGADNYKDCNYKDPDNKDSLSKNEDINKDSDSINHSTEAGKSYWSEYTPEKRTELIEGLKKNVAYESRKRKERPEDFELYDTLVNVVIDFINSPPRDFYVQLAGKKRPYNEVVEAFMKLRFEHINCARNKIKGYGIEKITDIKAFSLPTIFRLSEIPVSAFKDNKNKSSGSDFEQRDYDFDELERIMLAKRIH